MRLRFLRHLYDSDMPFATVWMDTTHDTEDARQRTALRWRGVRERLADDGAVPDDLFAMDKVASPGPLHGDQSQLIVSSGGLVVLSEHLPTRPVPEVVRVGALPHLMPWLTARSARTPHLLVLVDRHGADIAVRDVPRHHDLLEVEEDGYPLEKNAPGGWAQRRYQSAADVTWEHNAKVTADAVDSLRRRYRPEAVVVSGDQRARTALIEELPPVTRNLAVEVDGIGRAEGTSEDALVRDVEDALGRLRADEVEQATQGYEFAREHGRAAEGVDDVVAALAQGVVDTLVVTRPELDGTVWIGRNPPQVGVRQQDLVAMGVHPENTVRERVDAAVIRALVSNNGRFVPVDPGRLQLRDDVGAVLRYARREGG
jgi:Bacterial archaeo-eukaryotic release factor family 2